MRTTLSLPLALPLALPRILPLLMTLALAPACVDDDAPAGDDTSDEDDEDDEDVDDDDDDDASADDLTPTDALRLVDAPIHLLPAPDGGFRFARTTDERRASVPLEKSKKWRVIYSIEVVDLDPSERLAVRGEVQLTTCQASDLGDTPCKRITPFDPAYTAKIILGTSASDTTGVTVTPAKDVTCSHFKHHCALALAEGIKGDMSGKRFVNLIVAATGSDPKSEDRMIVDDAHGGLDVTRIGAGADAKGDAAVAKDVSPGWMSLDTANYESRAPHVTFQVALSGAVPGEIVDVDAKIVAITDGQGGKPAGCSGARDPLLSHQVLLSKHKNDPIASKLATLTAKNGGNCHLDDTCTYRKSGAAVIPGDAPSTVYVSVISWGGRSCSSPQDRWKIGGQSEVTVRRRKKK